MSRDGWSIDAALAKGRPLPEWYLDEPPLQPGYDFFMLAFSNLSTCRDSGFGSLGRIPWDKIDLYADRSGLDEEMSSAFVVILRAMDEAYIGWQEQEADKRRSAQKRGNNRPKG